MSHDSTTRRRFVALAGSLTLAGTAGCAGPGGASTQEPTDPPEGTTTPTRTDPPTTASTPDVDGGSGPAVTMVTDDNGSYFDPVGLQVEPGTTVRFVNESGSHNTAAYHPDTGDVPLRIPEGAEPWDSELFSEAGETFEVTLETPGVYDFYCRPHEVLGMVGRLVVGEPQGGPGTTAPEEVPPSARETFPSVDEIREQGSVSGP